MNDTGNKIHRRLLLRNLTGDSAFATTASKDKWLAKHGAKSNNKTDEEGSSDAVSL